MKVIITFLTAILLFVSCQTTSSKVEEVSTKQTNNNSPLKENSTNFSSIREVDFQNFTFPWTKKFGYGEKSFSLKNGISELSDNRKLSLESLSYIDDNEQALIVIKIDDGNATYQMLYVYEIENSRAKLLESFEFGENNISFGTSFVAHDELVIETYHQVSGDAECCPSIIEISYYKWQKDKFVLQGEPQKIPNGYVERLKKKNETN
jgi:hypothetical protein